MSVKRITNSSPKLSSSSESSLFSWLGAFAAANPGLAGDERQSRLQHSLKESYLTVESENVNERLPMWLVFTFYSSEHVHVVNMWVYF